MKLLVSGASRGIGRATAIAAAEEGHTVFALARDRERLDRMKASVQGIHPLPLDLTREDLEERLAETFREEGVRGLDGVVNAAGVLEPLPFQEQSKSDWERTLAVNLIGPARLLKGLHPYLLEGNEPHVVLIGSMAGYPGSKKFAGMSAYGASKSALAALGETLAAEWEGDGIRVNTLALGGVDTEMFRKAFPESVAPLSPEAMASFILSFLHEGGAVMNGKHLPVSRSSP